MRDKGKAGVGRVVISRRERMVLLEPLGKGILATLLRYPYEVRGEEAYFEDIPDLNLPTEMRDLAGHIIETKAADFDPSKFEDRYENAMIELIRSKQTGKAPEVTEAPRPSNVVNLMDALRRSIEAEEPPAAKKAASKSKTERTTERTERPATRGEEGPLRHEKGGMTQDVGGVLNGNSPKSGSRNRTNRDAHIAQEGARPLCRQA